MLGTLFVPVVLIVGTVPMILGMVPRNPIYGFRTGYTMSSDEVWYRANRIAGVALFLSGLVWCGLAIVLPVVQPSMPERLIRGFGFISLMVGVAVSFALVYRTKSN